MYPKDRVIERLSLALVPAEVLHELQPGFVAFVKSNRPRITEFTSAILPTRDEARLILQQEYVSLSEGGIHYLRDVLRESLNWLQWLMFEGNPESILKNLSDINIDHRGVCGAVWGSNDIAYRCRTCEHDPTCAICVPCFQNGNHKDHDYSIIYTGGGCCDCGDATAWKREGFCSKHKGSEQIQSLPQIYASSVGPVLDPLLIYWRDWLVCFEAINHNVGVDDHKVNRDMANEVTFVIVEMLLEFCRCSESLLSFVSKRLFSTDGFLDVLLKTESFLLIDVVEILHGLLLKLLGEPSFKYEFAAVFLHYYPNVVKEAIQTRSDTVMKAHPLLSTFSVQIFTVPTLTPRLVKEMNLLEMLLGCLGDIFTACVGDDDRLLISKWANLYETTLRVAGDIRFALSHEEVSSYVVKEQPDILRAWMQLLAFAQGMDPQKRETRMHIEEESNNIMLPFVLGRSFTNIHSLFLDSAFCPPSIQKGNSTACSTSSEQGLDDGDGIRHAKVGRISQENDVNISPNSLSLHSLKDNEKWKTTFPFSIVWILHQCLRSIDNYLGIEYVDKNALKIASTDVMRTGSSKLLALKEILSKIQKRKHMVNTLGLNDTEDKESSSLSGGYLVITDTNSEKISDKVMSDDEVFPKVDGSIVEGGYSMNLDAFKFLRLHEWPIIAFDVSSQDVSMHIPLHRFLSLLLIKSLEKCCAEVPNVDGHSSSLRFDFFEHVLRGCHPYGFSACLMEHPLRNRVFCAQVRAGMWRRNGDSVEISHAWYRAFRWGGQDLELDLFLLQCCAAVAPADFYVTRIIERFGLSGYISQSLDLPSEYETILVLEMLTLLIHIIQERRFCGQTTVESLRRELICRLSIGDATRSQLLKFLPRELSKSGQFQEVLDNVASYSNPSGLNQGMYSLRWHCWKELDLYYPRWNSRELQIAEERYLQICRTSALVVQVPKWSRIYFPFEGVARVATCLKVFHIIRSVIYYAVMDDNPSATRAPDMVLIAALHLLSLVLDVCHAQFDSGALSSVCDSVSLFTCCNEIFGNDVSDGSSVPSLVSLLILLMRACKNKGVANFGEVGTNDIYSLTESLFKRLAQIDSGCMERLRILAPEIVDVEISESIPSSVGETWKSKARERQAAILEKMKAEQSKFLAGMKSDEASVGQETRKDDVGCDSQESVYDVCSLCRDPSSSCSMTYLILLQKSRLLSFVDRTPPSWDQAEQVDNMHFLLPGPSLIDQLDVNSLAAAPEAVSPELGQSFVNECNFDKLEADLYFVIQRDSRDVASALVNDQSLRELEGVNSNLGRKYLDALSRKVNRYSSRLKRITGHSEGAPILVPAYYGFRSPNSDGIQRITRHGDDARILVPAYDGFGPTDSDGIHLSSCGHAVHHRCLDLYLSSLRERSRRRILFEGGHIVDPDKGEFLCPVCRRLANSVLPALPGRSFKTQTPLGPNAILRRSLGRQNNIFCFRQGLSLLMIAAAKSGTEILSFCVPSQTCEKIATDIEPVMRILQQMYFMGRYDLFSEAVRVNPSMILWDMLKYSLMSMEVACRSASTTLSPVYDLSYLYAGLKSSNGFILSLLLNVVFHIHSKNFIHVIQRYRGIALFAKAVCFAASSGTNADENIESLLTKDDQDLQYPDIQFWERAAAPVISYNSFCSLMLVLFCLPYQFAFYEDTFHSIVHLFYAITIVQAIITCCGKYGQKIRELEFQDTLISDIANIIAEDQIIQQYFVASCIDISSNIHDTIRRLTFPYLRRCALLWKLLNISSQWSAHSSVSEESSSALADILDSESNLRSELDEIEKLEEMFRIPVLDTILRNVELRSQSLKWIQHFMKKNVAREPKYRLFCNPATPFRLVQLPYIYQDLLERYIKQWCPDCESALCLLCGKLCYDNPSSCCRKKGCQLHTESCGTSIGLFLLIRKTNVLIQRSIHRTKWHSLYLDAFGEEDYDMQRGRPLYLNEERYAVLTNLVVSHSLDQSSKVLRQTNVI